MNADFSTRILASVQELAAIENEWLQLCERCSSTTPFQRPEWILAWLEVFSPTHIRTIEVRRDGKVVGLAPLLIYSRREERVLAFMAGGVSDYLDLLADPALEHEIVSVILDSVAKLEGWTTFDLTDVSARSVLRRTLLSSFATVHDSCSVLTFPGSEKDLLQLLSKRQRANLRNGKSRLERAGGGEVEVATSESLPSFLDDLFYLHTTRWAHTGESGVLAQENIRAFHRKAAPTLLARGILRMCRLRVSGRTVAAMHTLRQQSTTFCYLQGFDPEFAFLSPGTQLMFSAIIDALQSGMNRFDFLRGEESYKDHWRAVSEPTYRIELSRTALKSVLLAQDVAA
ncbi:MAG TPA: GNAT family N-acetyltransferase [Terriglobales bacterium]|nr:GNAT family N-acetyltransferase [Terriglobales bacterium]